MGTIIGSESLTTVFGMGTGGPFGYGHRERNTGAVARAVILRVFRPLVCDNFWIGKCILYAAQFNIDLIPLLLKAALS